MTKHLLNRPEAGQIHPGAVAVMVLFFMIGLCWPTPVTADGPPPGSAGYRLYLPLVAKGNEPAVPASPYAQVLTTALERCQTIALNQLCAGNGQVQLQTAAGGQAVLPGSSVDLTNGQGVTVLSSGAEANDWGAALLRLQADSAVSDQELLLLAFGSVQISDILLFDGVGSEDAILPALRFASSPVPGAPPGVSGLLLYNPAGQDRLSLNALALNGAVITLETSAFSQAQPGAAMELTSINGAVLLVDAGQTSSAVLPGHRLTLPLDAGGLVSGAPGTGIIPASDILAPFRPVGAAARAAAGQPIVDILYKAVQQYTDPTADDFYDNLAAIYAGNVDQVFSQCVNPQAPDPRAVFGLMVLHRMLRTDAQLAAAFGSGAFDVMAQQMKKCATFELEFDSQINNISAVLTYKNHVNSKGLLLQFGLDGKLLAQNASAPIKHLDYQIIGGDVPGCTRQIITADGDLRLQAASLTPRGSKLRIRTGVMPTVPFEEAKILCPSAPPADFNTSAWQPWFFNFYQSKLSGTPPAYQFNDWKYNGRKNFAETIYADTLPLGDYTNTSDFYMILIHTPQP